MLVWKQSVWSAESSSTKERLSCHRWCIWASWRPRESIRPKAGTPFDLQLLVRSDELLVLQLPGWEDSKGVLVEIAGAQVRGMPIRLMSLEEAGLPNDILKGLSE